MQVQILQRWDLKEGTVIYSPSSRYAARKSFHVHLKLPNRTEPVRAQFPEFLDPHIRTGQVIQIPEFQIPLHGGWIDRTFTDTFVSAVTAYVLAELYLQVPKNINGPRVEKFVLLKMLHNCLRSNGLFAPLQGSCRFESALELDRRFAQQLPAAVPISLDPALSQPDLLYLHNHAFLLERSSDPFYVVLACRYDYPTDNSVAQLSVVHQYPPAGELSARLGMFIGDTRAGEEREARMLAERQARPQREAPRPKQLTKEINNLCFQKRKLDIK